MSNNLKLRAAKRAKKDEFYTQYHDIENEMNAYIEFNPDVFRDKTILLPCDNPEVSNFTKYFAANFDRLGIKKLISTSYAKGADKTIFERFSPLFDEDKHETRGKVFTLTKDINGSGHIDQDDIEFSGYLEGDGDFRSAEVTALRDEADIIITNPPFSLFREFIAWITNGGEKQFIVMGNVNAITGKEIFTRICNGELWLGFHGHPMKFHIPNDYPLTGSGSGIDENGKKYATLPNIRWFTNMDHGKRHNELLLDTLEHNLRFNKKLRKKLETTYGELAYPRYKHYPEVIEIPFVEAIPSDYTGVMAVPITFMDKFNPTQFEILEGANTYGIFDTWNKNEEIRNEKSHGNTIGDNITYFRIHIRHKHPVIVD